MSTASLGAVLASATLCCLAPQSASTTSPASSGSYVIQCEVWNVTEPGLVAQIEAQEPTAAEAVLQSLQSAAKTTGFETKRPVVELLGTCAQCTRKLQDAR